MKSKISKLFLAFVVLLFNIIFAGCSNNENININAEYLEANFSDINEEGEYEIIKTYFDFIVPSYDFFIFSYNQPTEFTEKYNDDYFKEKSFVAFKIIETDKGKTSKIKSYSIENNIITINVKSIKNNDKNEIKESVYVILELDNKELENVDKAKIIKNGKDISYDNYKPVGTFYSLEDAYENNLLSRENLLIAWENFNNEVNVEIDFNTELDIKKDIRLSSSKFQKKVVSFNSVCIRKFYGIFDNVIILDYTDESKMFSFGEYITRNIDGIVFEYSDDVNLVVWYKN